MSEPALAFLPSTPRFDPEISYRLSPRIYLKASEAGEGLWAENLETGGRIFLANSTQVGLVTGFLAPARPVHMVANLDEARRSAVLCFLETCVDSGLLIEEGEAPGSAGKESDEVAHWEDHDLLFHLRSRRGRTPTPVGATYALNETLAPEPAISELAHPIVLRLPRGKDRSDRESRSLTDVLESRRSLYRTTPVSLDDLGEILYRTLRITHRRTAENGDAFLKRVYPSGGGMHSLDFYVVPARCTGLGRGLYQYRAETHALARVSGPGPDLEALLEEARQSAGRLSEVPSVLLIFSVRLRRVARKYSGLAYSLVLKEVGAVFQTLYLVATDMGLAPCALGTGDSERFHRASGKDFFQETSVGEFILGGPKLVA